MKTLVIQLARLGDIYQCWPTLKALKSSGQEVHLLTRASFAQAAPTFIDRHWSFDTKSILKPLIDERPDVDQSLQSLRSTVESLKQEQFDRVMNLSYSPFSASLASEIGCAETIGYSRHDDRTLKIDDDASAYFYAQVGVGKHNRLHVIDLFAHTAGVAADWSFDRAPACPLLTETTKGAVVIHLGASDLAKTLSWSKWLQVIKGVMAGSDAPVVLVGSKDEAEIAEKVSAVFGARKPINLVGRTSLSELYAIIESAALVVGGDSAPVQIASLTNTPVFNLSFAIVNPWETGPRSAGSRILCLESEDSYTSEEISREILATLHRTAAQLPVLTCESQTSPYSGAQETFGWELVKALYMGELFPAQPSHLFLMGLQRLEEVNTLAIEQIAAMGKDATNQTAALILDRVDEVMAQIVNMVPETAPMVGWFQTERLRIAPGPLDVILEQTRSAHMKFGEVLSLYLDQGVAHEVAQLDKK